VLSILHDAAGLVCVDKPPDLPSTGRTPTSPGSVEFLLARQLRRQVWAVHQLDRQTSGCNIFVLKRSLVQPTGDALRRGLKVYVCLCRGAVSAPFTVDAPIGTRVDRDTGRRFPTADPARLEPGTARTALTRFIPLATSADGQLSLLIALPRTGRTHQIRIHLGDAGHPLVGEQLHADRPCALAPRHQLHAAALFLASSGPSEGIAVTSPLPADTRALLEAAFAPGTIALAEQRVARLCRGEDDDTLDQHAGPRP
jgi:23S rRNA-/tRNA-specific pseudouridylate synthase